MQVSESIGTSEFVRREGGAPSPLGPGGVKTGKTDAPEQRARRRGVIRWTTRTAGRLGPHGRPRHRPPARPNRSADQDTRPAAPAELGEQIGNHERALSRVRHTGGGERVPRDARRGRLP